ncbi:hypothetical protein [Mycolicibacterium elephantis]
MFQSILKIKMITVQVNGNEMAWVCENHFGIRTCPNGVLRLLARQLRCTETNFGGRKNMKVASKDDKNLQKVLDKIAKMDEPARSVMHRMQDVIVSAALNSSRASGTACRAMPRPRAVPSSSSSARTS